MSVMLDHCAKYKPRESKLPKKADEETAQLLAMYRTASMASRMSSGKSKVSAVWIRTLVTGGPPDVNKTRANNFKARVNFLASELEDDFDEAKKVLVQRALEVYLQGTDPKFVKRHPKISSDMARHIMEETHFFNSKNGDDRPKRDRKELELKVKKILARRKRLGK